MALDDTMEPKRFFEVEFHFFLNPTYLHMERLQSLAGVLNLVCYEDLELLAELQQQENSFIYEKT